MDYQLTDGRIGAGGNGTVDRHHRCDGRGALPEWDSAVDDVFREMNGVSPQRVTAV